MVSDSASVEVSDTSNESIVVGFVGESVTEVTAGGVFEACPPIDS